MLAVVPSATLYGLDGRIIRVEVDVAPGLPGFTVVGLGDTAVQEARERVRGAIRNSGFAFPPRRLTVNLAPAELRKTGASLDLAIAVGILLGSEQARAGPVPVGLIGELGLDGEVRPVPGVLPMVAALAARGIGRLVVAPGAVDEGRLVEGVEVVGASTLLEAAEVVRGKRPRRRPVAMPRVTIAAPHGTDSHGSAASVPPTPEPFPDLAEVRGQAQARRALEIALAGGHGLLMTGPPGVGKTLLARTIPGLLPPLDDAAALAATIVASAAGEGPVTDLRRQPPFRAPHHTLSYAAMVGGGASLSPGEITRAHHGTLFLDELAEFDRDVLEALRQPLEEGRILIARAGRVVTFPARFQLIAAMNPCPCGFAGSYPEDRCRCRPGEIDRYNPAGLRAAAGPDRPLGHDATGARRIARLGTGTRKLGDRRRADHDGSCPSDARSGSHERSSSRTRVASRVPADGGRHSPPRRPRRDRARERPRHRTPPPRRPDHRGPGRLDGGRATTS
jgi:magnesium chelatase family protein